MSKINIKLLRENLYKFLNEDVKFTGNETIEDLEDMRDEAKTQEDMDTIDDKIFDLESSKNQKRASSYSGVKLKLNLEVDKTYTHARKIMIRPASVSPHGDPFQRDASDLVQNMKNLKEVMNSKYKSTPWKKSDLENNSVTYDPSEVKYKGRLNDVNRDDKNFDQKINRALDTMVDSNQDDAISNNYYVFQHGSDKNYSVEILSPEEVNDCIWDFDELVSNISTNIQSMMDNANEVKDVKILPHEIISFTIGSEVLKFKKDTVFNFLEKNYNTNYRKLRTQSLSDLAPDRIKQLFFDTPENTIDNESRLKSVFNEFKIGGRRHQIRNYD